MAPVAVCGLALPGCSLSIPMAGLGTDEAPTGTIKAPDRPAFAAEMDPEDWRRAKSALDTALDPQGNGAGVAWNNPQSGAKGVFVPVAQAFPKDDRICREFSVAIALKGAPERSLRSSACRRNGGDWVVIVAKRTIPAVPRPNKNLVERDTATQLN